MKKTLSLLLALVLVLGSFSTVFAAMPETDVEKAELLKELGILLGDNSGDLMLEKDLIRAEAVVLLSRLMKAEDVAKEFPVDDLPFDDVTDPIYPHYVAWAVANDLTQGISATKFDPKGDLTAQQFATFLLRALGYEIDAEAYETAFETAEELGIFADLNVEKETVLKRKDMAVMTFNALYVPMKDSEVTLGEFLELELPQDEPEVPATLEAEVVADNLKSFMVVFNQPVKSASVKAKTTSEIEVETKLSDDKTTLFGFYKGNTVLTQSASVTFTINAETEEGLKLEDFEVKKTVNDVTIPAALSARALNPKQIEILFSEPVQLEAANAKLLSEIKVDGKEVVAESSVNYFDNTVIITLLAPMTEGTKIVEVAKVKDFANFVAPTAEFNITVVKDEEAPVAISAEVKNNKEIIITFNEPLSKAAIGTYTVDGKTAKAEFVDGTNYTQVKLTLSEALSIGAIVEVRIGYKGQKDIMGNEVKETTYITTKVEDDTTLPTVELTEVKVVSGKNVLVLTFSKPMSEDGKYQILDKDDKVVVPETSIPPFKDDTNKTVLEISVTLPSGNPAEYKIKLTEMKDASIRQNPLGTVTLTFTSKDIEAPTVVETAKLTKAEKEDSKGYYTNTITIYFSEAMDKESLENLANYMIGDIPLHIKEDFTKIAAGADNKSVVLTYKSKNQNAYEGAKIVVLPAVKDQAGNKIDEEKNTATITAETADALALKLENAKLVALDKIEVKFNTDIETVYPSLLKLKDVDDNYFESASIKSDGKTVVFTLAKKLASDAEPTLIVVDPSLVVNKFGNKLSKYKVNDDTEIDIKAGETEVAVAEEVAPVIVKVERVDDLVVKFTFSENVKVDGPNTFKKLMVKKADGTVTDVKVEAVYKNEVNDDNLVSKAVYEKVFILYFSDEDITDFTGLELGFPIGSDEIKDQNGNVLRPTEWFKVK